MALVVGAAPLVQRAATPSESSPARQQPLPAVFRRRNRPEGQIDGFIVGDNGVAVRGTEPFSSVDAVVPSTGKPQALAIFVNGVGNTAKDQADEMHSLADSTGLEFLGVHNSTGGLVADVGEAILQKLGFDRNARPAEELAKVILERLESSQPLKLFAHSQGALMLSEALRHVKDALMKKGAPLPKAEAMMSDLEVETYATAAGTFPDGPKYVHYINDNDFVPSWFGTSDPRQPNRPAPAWGRWIDGALGSVGIDTHVGSSVATAARSMVESAFNPGRGAAVVHFKDDGKGTNPGESMPEHRLSTYLKHRMPFDEARRAFASQT